MRSRQRFGCRPRYLSILQLERRRQTVQYWLCDDARDLRRAFLPSFFCRYEYSHSTDRFWRKNRSPGTRTISSLFKRCYGVDLNRNFGFHWGDYSSSLFKDHRTGSQLSCVETYSGPKSFSEKETKAIKDFVSPRSHLIVVRYLFSYEYQRPSSHEIPVSASSTSLFIAMDKRSYIRGATLKRRWQTGHNCRRWARLWPGPSIRSPTAAYGIRFVPSQKGAHISFFYPGLGKISSFVILDQDLVTSFWSKIRSGPDQLGDLDIFQN